MMRFAVIGLLFFVAACAGVLGKRPTAPQLYVLQAPATSTLNLPTNAAAKKATIKIALPEMAPGLDTARIGVLEEGQKLNYYADASWAEPLPNMLQALLLDSFEQSKAVRAASSDIAGVQTEYTLQLSVQALNAVSNSGATQVQVRYRARLLANGSRSLIATIPVEQTVAADANNMSAVIAAFAAASDAAAKQVIAGVVAAIPKTAAKPKTEVIDLMQ